VFRVSASNRFETVVAFLRKKLRLEAGVGGGDAGSGLDGGGSVFCYVNSVFAPGLDEGVGALWRVSFGVSIFPFTFFYHHGFYHNY
jgi:ubiquitin-like protein ATG12